MIELLDWEAVFIGLTLLICCGGFSVWAALQRKYDVNCIEEIIAIASCT